MVLGARVCGPREGAGVVPGLNFRCRMQGGSHAVAAQGGRYIGDLSRVAVGNGHVLAVMRPTRERAASLEGKSPLKGDIATVSTGAPCGTRLASGVDVAAPKS